MQKFQLFLTNMKVSQIIVINIFQQHLYFVGTFSRLINKAIIGRGYKTLKNNTPYLVGAASQ